MKYRCIALCLALIAGVCSAETKQQGDFEIHYTVFPSTIIPADVAQAHQISRAKNQIVVNVSLLKDNEPAKAQLQGQVTNLLEQVIDLNFVEVNESNAIYYLASHRALPDDILRFNLTVTPAGAESIPVSFLRRYD